jgi:hypothetical protein
VSKSYDEWRRSVATTLINNANDATDEANAATEADRNRALTEVESLQAIDPTLSQSRIDSDVNQLLGEQARYAGYQADFSGSEALLGQDRAAGLSAAAALGRGGTAMTDRATQLEAVNRLEAAAGQAGDTRSIASERAMMLRDLAEYEARNAGFGEDRILQVLDQAQGRERANNEQIVSSTLQQLASQGVQASPWMVSQIRASLNGQSEERLRATETSLRMEDYKLRDSARQFSLAAKSGVLESMGTREQEARNAELSGRESATQARETALSSTRQDQLTRENAGAALSTAVRQSTREGQQTLDQVREQLQATRDTQALAILDSILKTGRDEERANLTALTAKQQYIAAMVTDILSNTSRVTTDAGTLAQIISALSV